MNKLLLINLFCISIHVGAADQKFSPAWAGFTLPKNDGSSNDVVYVRGENGGIIEEAYNFYCCSLNDTVHAEDTTFNHYMKTAIFAQLCAQASKAQNIDMEPFYALIQRIRVAYIDITKELVCMTNKDMHHRLLSYIPKGQEFALVNDKKVQIMFTPYERIIKKGKDPNPNLGSFPKFREGRSYVGNITEKTGEVELTINNYDFTMQSEHHAQITAEFNNLILLTHTNNE